MSTNINIVTIMKNEKFKPQNWTPEIGDTIVINITYNLYTEQFAYLVISLEEINTFMLTRDPFIDEIRKITNTDCPTYMLNNLYHFPY